MRPFALARADSQGTALERAGDYLAGGTTLLDLMKLDVMRPESLINIGPLRPDYDSIEASADGLTLGALVRMSEAADHPEVQRAYPVLSQSLAMAASAQLRNMASLSGTVLQRTRCNYFRDVGWTACNKRSPGSGCAALHGKNRLLAVLGTSEHCIAHYPGDFATALAALGADVDIVARDGSARTIGIEDLHRLPGDAPHIETTLAPGDLITAFRVPAGPWTRRSLYVKVRDRDSYAFALASAAVALDLAPDGTVNEARIGLGGVAAKPWRAHEAEAALKGRRLDEASAQQAADAAFAAAVTHGDNDYKPELGRRTLVRALFQAQAMEI